MTLRLIGAGLIVAACSGFGFMLAANHKREERTLKQLQCAITFMECQLQYRMSSLPELSVAASEATGGAVSKVLNQFAAALESQRYADPGACMEEVLSHISLSNAALKLFRLLGQSVGKFDLEGQLRGLHMVQAECDQMLGALMTDRDIRIRNYQTLGLCAGAALAILLI